MKLIVDLETNGFLDKNNLVIHCIVCKDIETNQVYSYNPKNLMDSLELLNKAEVIIGHNLIGFDVPVLKKVLNYNYKGEVFDTLLMSRLIWTNLLDTDYKCKELPAKLYGRHTLEAWGYRVGLRKGDYQEHSDFSEYNLDMLEYCQNDVEVTHLLYDKITKENYSSKAIELAKRKLDLEDKLSLAFPSWDKNCGYKRYKRDNKKRGIKANVPIPVIKRETFNPNSRQHIADRLTAVLGWKPKTFTPTGQPEINEKVLDGLKYPEAKIISE